MTLAMTSFDAAPEAEEYSDSSLALRILTGKHAGAEHPLQAQDFLILGSGQDCEIIMTDEGVAPHHCIISRVGDKLTLRAVDASVSVGNADCIPGHLQAVSLGQSINLGQSTLVINAAANEQLDNKGPGLFRLLRPGKRIRLFLVFLAFLCLVTATGFYTQRSLTPDIPTEPVSLLAPASPTAASGKSLSDYTGSELAEHMLSGNFEFLPADGRGTSSHSNIEAQAIARDVKEIFRLSGVHVQSQALQDGKVQITGHFGDGEKAAEVIQSRAIREIDGLRQIVVVNLDVEPKIDAPKPEKAAPVVTQLVTGADPYLVTTDGSRFYPGAVLPDGSRLIRIRENHMVIEHQASFYEVLAAGEKLDGHYLNPNNRVEP